MSIDSNSEGFPDLGLTRRHFLQCTAAGVAVYSLADLPAQTSAMEQVTPTQAELIPVQLQVNGKPHDLQIEPRVTLLDALRENLGLTGTKKGCDHGQCGACTVLVEGRRIYSCLTLAVMHAGTPITTIEGLAQGEELHPMQAAFITRDAFQCGYCTSGQICSALGLLKEGHAITAADIREQMSGNICRCGAYPNIVAAIQDAQTAVK